MAKKISIEAVVNSDASTLHSKYSILAHIFPILWCMFLFCCCFEWALDSEIQLWVGPCLQGSASSPTG